MGPNIITLSAYTVMDKAKATKIAAGLNAEEASTHADYDPDTGWTYMAELKDHGYVIAVYEFGEFVGNL